MLTNNAKWNRPASKKIIKRNESNCYNVLECCCHKHTSTQRGARTVWPTTTIKVWRVVTACLRAHSAANRDYLCAERLSEGRTWSFPLSRLTDSFPYHRRDSLIPSDEPVFVTNVSVNKLHRKLEDQKQSKTICFGWWSSSNVLI